MAITVQMRTQVAQLYVALFGRAPDGEGLGFWVGLLDQGRSFVDVANTMYATAPARQFYPSFLTNQEIISAFYSNVLGRSADADGLAFWTGKLNAAGATPGSVIAEMIGVVANYGGTDPAGLTSQALFNNRVTVAQYYGEKNGSIQGATDAIKSVTADPASVTAANKAIDDGSVVGVNQGLTLTLTNQTDNLVGGSGNDTFIGDATSGSAGDTLTGGAGFDQLKMYGTSTVPNISSIESVYYNAPGAAIDLRTKAEVTQIEVDNAAAGADVTLAATQSLTLSNNNGAGNIVRGNTVSTVNLTVDAIGTRAAQATVDLAGTTASTLNLKTADAASDFVLTNSGTALKTVTVAGDKNVRIDTALATITSIDASTMTGALNIGSIGASTLTFTGGKGADRLNIGATLTNADKLDGGEGDDVIAFSDADTLTTANTVNVKNFEVLQVLAADATAYNVDNLGLTNNPVKAISIAESGGAGTTINNITDAAVNAISFIGDTPTAITLTAKNFVSGGTTDTATITLDNNTLKNANGVDVATSLTFSQVDVLNIVSKSDGTATFAEQNSVAGLAATDLEKIVVTGDQNFSLTTGAATTGLTEVDASALTGGSGGVVFDLNTSGSALTSILVKDTVRADNINVSNAATNLSTVYISGGNDTIAANVAGGAGEVLAIKASDATNALGTGALAAGTVITVNATTAAGGAVTIDLGTAVEALLKSANVVLGTSNANVALNGVALSATTNITAGALGATTNIDIDVNGNGTYDATADVRIAITGTAAPASAIFDATTKNIVVTY